MSASYKMVTITIGDNDVAIKREGESDVSIAKILGRETRQGSSVIYLDRLAHRHNESDFGGWNVSGAINTIMTKSV